MSLSGGVVDISPLLTLTLLTSLSLLPLLTLRLTDLRPNIRNITRPGLPHCRIISGVFPSLTAHRWQRSSVWLCLLITLWTVRNWRKFLTLLALSVSLPARLGPRQSSHGGGGGGGTVRTVRTDQRNFPGLFSVSQLHTNNGQTCGQSNINYQTANTARQSATASHCQLLSCLLLPLD